MLVKSELNSIETLISQALTDIKISHEEFHNIIKKKKNYEKMKENVRNASEKTENTRLNSLNSRTKKITRSYMIYVTCDFNWLKNV